MTPGLLINKSGGGVGGGGGVLVSNAAVSAKKRLAPQPPKPLRNGVSLLKTNKVEDSYSTMSTVSVNSSANSTVSEKSIKVKPARKPLPRQVASIDKVITGWIRVYCGPEPGEIYDDDPNKVLQINHNETVKEISMAMDLPVEYTIWLQIGGLPTRRLQDDECPLMIQETFLKKLGYQNEFRRSRMGIDHNLKWLLRFHIGPAAVKECLGVNKAGQVEILKGLVSPQWKTRSMCVVGSKLVIFPGNEKLIDNLNKWKIKAGSFSQSVCPTREL